jgi:CAAX prenyl protease-like protein
LARAALVAGLIAWFWPDYCELREGRRLALSGWGAALAGGAAVFVVWTQVDWDWAVVVRPDGFDPHRADGTMNWPLAVGRLAGLALVVPVMEELFWRSFLLRWIQKHDFLAVSPRQVGGGAMLASTALFAAEHYRWFAGLIAGALYALLYMRTGNLWVAIIAHMVTNAMLGIWVLATGSWQFW